MLIRKPVADVFEAVINPAITTRFWFTHSNGRLEPGKQVQWDWEMYHVSSEVTVLAIEEKKRILIEWSGYGTPTLVEWGFTAPSENTTFVSISNTGSSGTGDERVKQAISSTEGFTFVSQGSKRSLSTTSSSILSPIGFLRNLKHAPDGKACSSEPSRNPPESALMG